MATLKVAAEPTLGQPASEITRPAMSRQVSAVAAIMALLGAATAAKIDHFVVLYMEVGAL